MLFWRVGCLWKGTLQETGMLDLSFPRAIVPWPSLIVYPEVRSEWGKAVVMIPSSRNLARTREGRARTESREGSGRGREARRAQEEGVQ